MTLKDVIKIRLFNQQLADSKFKSIKDIVNWMGAIQAQDYAMSKWAAGIRTFESTQKSVDDAINKGEIFRTHVLRPTWHLVSSEDISWMTELTAPRVKASMKSRDRELGLTEEIYKKCNKIIIDTLSDCNNCSREIFAGKLAEAKILTNENRLSHILHRAELDGILCSGVSDGKKHTYALLNERVLFTITLSKDEALAKLASKYFQSHSPATLKDFIWWSGLSAKEAGNALEMIKPGLIRETIDSEIFWLPDSFSIPQNNYQGVYLLPAYDEFLISYKNREFFFPDGKSEHYSKSIWNNGVFYPAIIINKQIAGLWKRTLKRDCLLIEIKFFQPQGKGIKKELEKKIDEYSTFLSIDNKKIVINYNQQ